MNVSNITKGQDTLEVFFYLILFHILHFRCLLLNHIYHKQKCPMIQINTLLVNRETWNVFHTWTSVFLFILYIFVK